VALGEKYKVHRTTVARYVKQNFGLSRKKKRKVHLLNERQKVIRFQRSHRLYQFLKDNLDKIISTDEKVFHLSQANGETDFFFAKRGDRTRHFFSSRDKNFPKSVMVWGGISKSGKTKLRFIKPGVKVNAQYYIDEILKPFQKDDLKELYPNGDGILQQDSAPSHASKKTIDFLTKENIRFIPPAMWTPSSPDNAPLDYSIWHYMEVKLKKRKVRTLQGLKRTLTDIWNKMPQNIIDNVLNKWPSICLSIYKARGDNIEQNREKNRKSK